MEDAIALGAGMETCREVVARAAPLLTGGGGGSRAAALALHGRLGRSEQGVELCMQALADASLVPRACALLCEWRTEMAADTLVRLFEQQQMCLSPPWLKNVLSLRAPWCSDERLVRLLVAVLRRSDPWLCMSVWDCIAARVASAAAALVQEALEALWRVREDEQAVAHCWEGLLCALGPENARLPDIVGWTADRAAPLSAAVGVFCKWNMAAAPAAVQQAAAAAASRCFEEHEDWTCAAAGVQWLAVNRRLHPHADALLRRALQHWARPVRKGARAALGESCKSDSDSECDDDQHLLQAPGSQPLECCD